MYLPYHALVPLGLLATSVAGISLPTTNASLTERQATDHYVFAHFMIGIVSDRTVSDYDADIQRAKAAGIDAFALNIGTDPYTDQQLSFAYQSAANNNFKVFISFDFNWWHDNSDSAAVGAKIAQYGNLPAQLKIDNKVFVSSFAGDQLNIDTVRSASGLDLMIVPNWHPQLGTNLGPIDGALNWMAWDNDGNNKAPKNGQLVTVADGDNAYLSALGSKYYLAPVSPAFFTHFGPEVSYSKNWVFPSDLLWFNRWWQVLAMKPRFIEIVTWNDYGESHYVAPLASKHTDDGASRWINDMPHNGFLDMAKPFIAAFKAGASSPSDYITDEQIVYWYRPTPKDLDCDSTDNTANTPASNSSGNYFEGRPDGWQTMADQIFVVSLLKSAGTVQVNSGGTLYTYEAPAGASAIAVDFKVGAQSFALIRNGQTVLSGTSLRSISNDCLTQCGLYNFNFFSGTVPAETADPLGGDGFGNFQNGLKVACSPTPSLPAQPPATTAPSTTITVTASATGATSA